MHASSVVAGLVAGLMIGIAASLSLAADSYEPNDKPEEARPIAASEVVESWISGPEDVDWFRFVHRDRGPIRVEIASLPADYQLDLFVREPDGEIRAHGHGSPSHPSQSRKVFEEGLAAPGEYLVRVRARKSRVKEFDPVDSYFLVALYSEAPTPVREESCAD